MIDKNTNIPNQPEKIIRCAMRFHSPFQNVHQRRQSIIRKLTICN